MDLHTELEARGLIHQLTHPELKDLLRSKLTLYAGFDPTSDSLHVGSLFPLLMLKRFAQAGHRVIAVIGGATGMIGDPSGKSEERQLMTEDALAKNVDGMKRQMLRLLEGVTILNNWDWFAGMGYVKFLRDVGKHFTINHMLGKESVRARHEDRDHGISYTEFSYMLLQAYDFLHLQRSQQCKLQIGGSDQWGNITAGCELIRRVSQAEAYGLTHPLLLKSDGSKFGKSEKGNVWIDAHKTSPYEFYQFFLQTPDADVIRMLKQLTFLSLDEISILEKTHLAHPEERHAQRALAQAMTELAHSKQERERAESAASALFSGDLTALTATQLEQAFREAPSMDIAKARLDTGVPLVELLVECQLFTSKGAARKEIEAGGVYVNQNRMSDAQGKVSSAELVGGGRFIVLRKGKKTYHLIKVTKA